MPDDRCWIRAALERRDLESIKTRIREDTDALERRTASGDPPLIVALQCEHLELLRFLIEAGANPNPALDDGMSALHWAIEAQEPAATALVDVLVQAGAALHAEGINGWTSLHLAAARGKARIVERLLAAGAEIDRRKPIDGGETALMEAAYQGRADVVEVLLAHGADHRLRDEIHQRTALEMAAYAAQGPDPEILATLGQSDELVQAGLIQRYLESAQDIADRGDHAAVMRLLQAQG